VLAVNLWQEKLRPMGFLGGRLEVSQGAMRVEA